MRDPTDKEIAGRLQNFIEHEIVLQSATPHVRYYRFARPGDCFYAFDILTTHDTTVVNGDIGLLVLQKPLAWCRGVIAKPSRISWSCVAEKVSREIEVAQFCPEEARQALQEWVQEHPQVLEKNPEIDEDLYPETLQAFFDQLIELGETDAYEYDKEPLRYSDWFVNQVIAIRSFIRHLDSISGN